MPRLEIKRLALTAVLATALAIAASVSHASNQEHQGDLSRSRGDFSPDARTTSAWLHQVPTPPLRLEYVEVHVLKFDQSMNVRGSDVLFKFRAPGQRNSFLSMEFVF